MSSPPQRPPGETPLILLLAAIQFSHILDFVIMMPLGPLLMEQLSFSTTQFSFLVSSYSFSAAVMGLFSAFFLDRFERRRALLGLFSGFVLATLMCGLSWSYESLLLSRLFAGAFGGVVGAAVYSIVGEVIPEERRGRAMGVLMAAFSVASVAGVPAGLFLAESFRWQAPFLGLAVFSATLIPLIFVWVPRLQNHLQDAQTSSRLSQRGSDFLEMMRNPHHLQAFALITLMMMSGFSLIPFLSPFLIHNMGLSNADLPLVYLVGGLFTIVSSQIIGRATDRFGHSATLVSVTLLATLPVLLITQSGARSLSFTLVLTTLFMMLLSGRLVPAMALVTTLADDKRRGSFMSLFASVQQCAGGLASLIGGLFIAESHNQPLQGYPALGFFCTGLSLAVVGFVLFISRGHSASSSAQN